MFRDSVSCFRWQDCLQGRHDESRGRESRFKDSVVPELSLDDIETSATVDFKLYSRRRLLFPRCLGRAKIPIADMPNTDESYDPLLFFGGSSLATVGLKISSSTNTKEVAGILVNGSLKPKDSLSKIGPMLDCVVAIKRMIDILTESHPTAKLAWSIVSMGVDILKKQKDTNELVAKLYEIMISTYEEASRNEALRNVQRLTPVYEALFKQTISCAKFIEGHAKQSILGRVINTKLSDEVKRIREGFQELNNDLHMKISAETLYTALNAEKRDKINRNIEKLAAAASASSNRLGPKSTCMAGTRVQAIDEIEKWIAGRNGSTFSCRGMAGTGKSSLMATLHQRLTMQANDHFQIEDEIGGNKRVEIKGSALAAFIRYDRNTPSNTDKLIPTIAHSLCHLNPEIRTAISRVIKHNQSVVDMSPSSAKEQFKLLLQQPLTSIRGLEDGRSLVIIIDGLDEWDTSKEILAVLAEGFGPDLPFMRLIVSSRPLGYIRDAFEAAPATAQLDLDPSSKDADQDIRFYIGSRFRDIYKALPSEDSRQFRSHCEALDAIERLTIQTKGLFIWAVTVCNFIAEVPCEFRLQQLLNTQKVAIDSLATLYRTALDAIVSESRHSVDLKQYIHDVLAAIVAVGIPIHVLTLDKLAARQPGGPKPSYFLTMLGSVVQISREKIIQPVHRSFFDFLQDKEKCGDDWYVDVKQE
ncbi:hypothetical protein DFS33DRAFT_878717 [Desarmillaria ectypa]|nr:hypothetical protein DFS33DRAFT_878717 [Desarmillaria ectypa]